MPKKSKRHVVRKETGRKVPRISVMEKEKKNRQKLYTYVSIGAVLLLAIGIAIGAILGGSKSEAPKAEFEKGHFTQKDGYFEMDPPKDWAVDTELADIAPYGIDNTLKAYVFRPGDYNAISNTDAGAVATPSPDNIICAIAPKEISADVVEKFLTAQNVIDQKDIVGFLDKQGPLVGMKMKDSMGWILGQTQDKTVTQGSFVAIIKSEGFKVYMTAKYTDEKKAKEIEAALKTVKAKLPEILDAYTDVNGVATIAKPAGWKIDTSSESLSIHLIPQGLGAMIYPSGSKTQQQMTPEELNKRLYEQQKANPNDKDKPLGTVTSGFSIPTPLLDYMAVYSVDKELTEATFDNVFKKFVGFGLNKVEKPYTWMLENLKAKGLSLADSKGKYFISDFPVSIMAAKPAGNLFALVENQKGKVLIMAGWTNDGIKKIIIDTLNKIKSADPAGK